MSPPELSHLTTASPEYSNTAEEHAKVEKHFKSNSMKIIEVLKEEVNKSLVKFIKIKIIGGNQYSS